MIFGDFIFVENYLHQRVWGVGVGCVYNTQCVATHGGGQDQVTTHTNRLFSKEHSIRYSVHERHRTKDSLREQESNHASSYFRSAALPYELPRYFEKESILDYERFFYVVTLFVFLESKI